MKNNKTGNTEIVHSQAGVVGDSAKIEGGIHFHNHIHSSSEIIPENSKKTLDKQVQADSNIHAEDLAGIKDIFICYGDEDSETAMKLYADLKQAGSAPWLKEFDLNPGQNWKMIVRKAIKNCKYFLVLLSSKSLSEVGYFHKELKMALDILDEFPGDQVFIIPVRLDNCDIYDERLEDLFPVDLFPSYESGLEKLLRGLKIEMSGKNKSRPKQQDKPVPQVNLADVILPGGAVDAEESRFYIKRKADDDVLDGVQRQRGLVTIRGPRQTGKTSLMLQVYSRFRTTESLRPVIVDFQSLSEHDFESLDNVWKAVASKMEDHLGLDMPDVNISDLNISEYWNHKASYDRNLSGFLDKYVFSEKENPVLLCLDEVDRVFSSPVKNDFFASVRAFYNRGAYDPAWKKVRWILSTSSEPSFFIEDNNQSPFNIGLAVKLGAFNHEETALFANRHGLSLNQGDIGRIMDYVGGRPYPVHLILYHMALQTECCGQLFDAETAGGGVFQDHLKQYIMQFQQEPELASAMKQVICGKGCPNVKLADRLEAAGLVKPDDLGQKIVCTCSLYMDYFNGKI